MSADNAEANPYIVQLNGAGKVIRKIEKGRCLHDGYRRSLSLQYGGFSDKLKANRAYAWSVHAIGYMADGRARTNISPHKRENLFFLIANYLRDIEHQNIIEFGSFAGGSAIFMARALKEFHPLAKVYALDTFEGIPAPDYSRDAVEAGRFAPEGGVESIKEYAASLGLDNIEFIKGLFDETLPDILASGIKFGLAHMDADHYGAITYAQRSIWPSMTEGGYIVYDDPLDSSCMGAMEALEDFMFEKDIRTEQMYPHPVLRAHL